MEVLKSLLFMESALQGNACRYKFTEKVVDRLVDLCYLFWINNSINNSFILGVPGSIKKIRLANNAFVVRHLTYLYATASNAISVITHTCTSLQHLTALVLRHISMIHIAHEGKTEIQTVACSSTIFLISSSQFIDNADEATIGLVIVFMEWKSTETAIAFFTQFHTNRLLKSNFGESEHYAEQQSTNIPPVLHFLRFFVFHSDNYKMVPHGVHIRSSIVQLGAKIVESTRCSQERVVVHISRFIPIRNITRDSPYIILSSSEQMVWKSLYSPSKAMIVLFLRMYIFWICLYIAALP